MRPSNAAPGLFCLGLGILTLWLSAGLSDRAAADALGGSFLPRVLAILLILLSVLLLAGEVSAWRSGQAHRSGDAGAASPAGDVHAAVSLSATDSTDDASAAADPRRVLRFGAAMLAYSLLLPLIGYLIASFLAFAAMILVAGERRPAHVAVAAAATTGALYLMFGIGFNIEVPSGWVFR